MRAKKKLSKQMLALLLSAVMIAEPASAAVTYAAEPVIAQTVDSAEDVSEEEQDTAETEEGKDETDSGKTDGEEGDSKETGGDESGSEETGGDESGSDETGGEDQETDKDGEDTGSEEELPADETVEKEPEEGADVQDTVSDNTVSSNDLEQEEDEDNWKGTGHKAPKLEMQLTSAMVSEKRELRGTADRLLLLEKNVNYLANEAVFLADSRKYAETVAEGYGASLKSYEDGVAVITFPDEVTDIITMAEDEKVKLPAVYPNFYYTTCGDIVVYSDEVPTDENSIMSDSNDELMNPQEGEWYQYHHDEIKSKKAWDYNDAAGNGIKVAVIDSGIQKNHEDLKGRVATAAVTFSTPYNKAEDNDAHGTHVSGIIAANRNNGVGGAGIAYKSSIVSYKALEHNPLTGGAGGSTDGIIKAVNAAAKSGARVINMSLGGRGYDPLYEAAVNAAVSKGVVVVAAAGNDGEELSKKIGDKNYYSPACFDKVITVSAKEKGASSRASFSNYGSGIIDITAPGTDIVSSAPSNDYAKMKGTSQAAPMVAAAAAYIFSVSPDLKNNKTESAVDTVKSILKDSAAKGLDASWAGAGLLDVEAAVRMAAPTTVEKNGAGELTAPAVKIGETDVKNNDKIQNTTKITLSATVDGKSNDKIEIRYTTDGKAPTEKSTLYKDPFSIEASGNKTIKAVAIYYGKKSKVTSVKVNVNANMTSFAIASKTGSNFLGAGKSMNLVVDKVEPAYATNKKVTWEIVDYGNGATTGNNVTINPTSGQLKAAATIESQTTIKVKATAKDGGGAIKEMSITLLPKVASLTLTAPTLEGKGPYQLDYDKNKTVKMTVEVDPKDANTGIDYTTSNKNVATVSPAGEVTAVGNGKATITAKTTDGSNKKVTLQVQVTKQVQTIEVNSKTGEYQIAAGKTLPMVATVTSDATNKKVKWSITAGNAATINENNGQLKAKSNKEVTAVSKVTVKAETLDGSNISDTKEITIYPAITGSIAFEEGTSCTLGTTAKEKLKTSIQLQPYTNTTGNAADFFGRTKGSGTTGLENFSYTSSNTKIATVTAKGVVEVAGKTGTAKIKVTAKDGSGKSASFTVKVVNPVTSISIYSKTGGNIVGRNKTLALGALVNSDASNKKLKWTSSDEKIATVNASGKVKGISTSVASVTIYAEANDGSGVKASFTVKVRPIVTKVALAATNSLTGAQSYATNVVAKWSVGTVVWPTPAVFDETSPNTPINSKLDSEEFWSIVGYTCSNSNIIQLVADKDGILHFVTVNPGKATITYKALDGSGKSCKINVTVTK